MTSAAIVVEELRDDIAEIEHELPIIARVIESQVDEGLHEEGRKSLFRVLAIVGSARSRMAEVPPATKAEVG